MQMKNTLKLLSLAALAMSGLGVAPAMAQNPNYAPGDIVLYFQQFGGSNTVALNVGAATTFRDTTVNLINIANIGSLLADGTLGFGATWYDTSSVWWGAAGVFNSSTSTTTVTNGDPGRTLYISKARPDLGTEGSTNSTGWTVGGNTAMTTAASNIIQQDNRMETIATTTTLVEGTGSSNIDNQNPFNIAGTPTTAFGTFPGGVEAAFGAGSFGTFGGQAAESALDLYRILAVNNAPGQVQIGDGSDLRNGTYEGSFVISQTGNVSFIVNNVPEPSSALLLGAATLLGGFIRRRKSVA